MKKRVLAIFCAVLLVLTGCGAKKNADDTDGNSNQQKTGDTTLTRVNIADMFTERDYKTDYDESKSTIIQLTGMSASCESNAVEISGGTVTITDEGTYIH